MSEPLSLRDATVQDIQLELIRRSTHNAFDGEKVHASLLKHRSLWTAVLLDRPGVANYAKPSHLLTMGLIKLRDLPYNEWNADELCILTPTREAAKELANIAEDEEWCAETVVYEDQAVMDNALGVGRMEFGLLSIWWD